jgi:hypothetical protein
MSLERRCSFYQRSKDDPKGRIEYCYLDKQAKCLGYLSSCRNVVALRERYLEKRVER